MIHAATAKEMRSISQDSLSFLKNLVEERLTDYLQCGFIQVVWPEDLTQRRDKLTDEQDSLVTSFVESQIKRKGWCLDDHYHLKPLD